MMARLFMAAAMLTLVACHVEAATTLLPNGRQCFSDANGPLTSGSVGMFTPNTNIAKTTWTDSSQSAMNTNPINLDANGCAVIYGVGSYRQIVYSGPNGTGTTVWDQVTTDTSAFNSTFWAGLAGGTANVITVTYPGFNGTDGSVVQFVALSTNTGAVTLNPSGFGAISVVKDTSAGPVSLTGGEITAGNVVNVVYYATTNTFHLLNTVIQSASGATSPLCGAIGLTNQNDGSVPNSRISVAASQAVMQSNAGLVINRSSIAATINLTVNGANGLDTGAVAADTWYYIWLIDNGSGSAAIASTSATAPTMPSGYSYKCRVGAALTDGLSNLYRFIQKGSRFQYKVVSGSNTTATFLRVVNGTVGSNCSTATPTWSSTNISLRVPPTAVRLTLFASVQNTTAQAAFAAAAPNSDWPGYSQNPPPPIAISANSAGAMAVAVQASQGADMILETAQTFFACTVNSSIAATISVLGFTDAVNAN